MRSSWTCGAVHVRVPHQPDWEHLPPLRRTPAPSHGAGLPDSGDKSITALHAAAVGRGVPTARLVTEVTRGGNCASFRPSGRQLAALTELSRIQEELHSALAGGASIRDLLRVTLAALPVPALPDGEAERARTEAVDALCRAAAEHDTSYAKGGRGDAGGGGGGGAAGGGAAGGGAAAGGAVAALTEDAVASLETFLMARAVGGGGAESGASRGVTLSTVHQAKGLEWKVVWIAGTEDGSFPHARGLREALTPHAAAEVSAATSPRAATRTPCHDAPATPS